MNFREKLSELDADGLAANTQKYDMVILDIDRHYEVEPCDISSSLERLLALIDTQETTMLYHQSLIFQVSGYSEDPRELYEIPEVRRFFKLLADQFPHWFWFLKRDYGQIVLLIDMLCKVQITRTRDIVCTEVVDDNELEQVIDDLLNRGNSLFNAYQISEELRRESYQSAMAEIFTLPG
jgi:hypothetical protein